MRIAKKRCRYCRKWFEPNPRTARFQKCCGRDDCRRERRRQKLTRWRVLHPDRAKKYQPKMRAWAKASNCWRRYRAAHPDYRERERQRMAGRRRRQESVANETAIGQILVEKLRKLDACKGGKSVANETPILRRVNAVEDCLRSTVAAVCVAKRTPIASEPSVAG